MRNAHTQGDCASPVEEDRVVDHQGKEMEALSVLRIPSTMVSLRETWSHGRMSMQVQVDIRYRRLNPDDKLDGLVLQIESLRP